MAEKYKHQEKYIRLGLNIAYHRKLKGMTADCQPKRPPVPYLAASL